MAVVPTYDAEQLAGVLAILPDVDAVELKLTVPDDDQRSAVRALGIDPLDAVVRQVAFVDTPDLRLSAAGVVVRARRTQRKPGDLTVKLRPMLPADVPEDLRGRDGFKVEVDASPAGYTCSCSLTAEVPDGKVRKLLGGSRTLSDLLDGTQRTVLDERLPEGVRLADLAVLGPVNLLKCRFSPPGHRRRMVAELWVLPGGARILELSTKAAPDAAFQAAAETKVLLAGHGIDLGAPQETKTATALAALVAERAEEEPVTSSG
ncbi:hypothetical protein GCM10009809_29800 [Isoptericola hypogeus]|uniref:CYTH domain-containing protein n=1 Tax=Isoptericola hypogeus TaxID=300179 RepID=A0ABN2JN41_9MICO